MGGQAQTASTPGAAAVAMLGVDGDFYTPGTQGVIRFSQINKTRSVKRQQIKFFFSKWAIGIFFLGTTKSNSAH